MHMWAGSKPWTKGRARLVFSTVLRGIAATAVIAVCGAANASVAETSSGNFVAGTQPSASASRTAGSLASTAPTRFDSDTQPVTDESQSNSMSDNTAQTQPQASEHASPSNPVDEDAAPEGESADSSAANVDPTQSGVQSEGQSPTQVQSEPTASTTAPSAFRSARALRAAPPGTLPAVFATGGTGRFRESIQWLQWSDYSNFLNPDGTINPRPRVPVLNYGETKQFKNYRDMGDAGYLLTTCTLSNLSFLQAKSYNGPNQPITDVPLAQAKGPLVATIPGTWAGDALDNLYNIGGAQGWKPGVVNPRYPNDAVNPNQMVIGLANGYAYVGNNSYEEPGTPWGTGTTPNAATGFNARVSFKMSCTAALHNGATVQAVPLAGLVFADAEASSNRDPYWNWAASGPEDEWVQASVTPGTNVTWRVLDYLRSAGCTDTKGGNPSVPVTSWAVMPDGTRTLRLMPSAQECVYQNGGGYSHPNGDGGPDVVTFIDGATEATFTIQGGGYSAIALGLIINTDFGDAPESYGKASSLFQPTWSGGEVTFHGQDLFGVNKATMSANSTILGTTVDAEGYQQHSADALGDDRNGVDDEDAITNASQLEFNVQPESTVQRTVSCRGPGKVAGWIDWNNNGTFDAGEKSNEVSCTGTSATLTWNVPANVVRSVDNEPGSKPATYMRLRITNDNNGNGQKPTGNTTTGEVEDYKVTVRVPTLQLIKAVEGPYIGSHTLLTPDQWALKGQTGNMTQPPFYVAGNGDTGIQTVKGGFLWVLSESSTNPEAVGYQEQAWSCKETPGTVKGTAEGYSSHYSPYQNSGPRLWLNNFDRVTCTITNVTKPGTITWNKVADETPGLRLGGSTWALSGPGVPANTVVTDCVSAPCAAGAYRDQDPSQGAFKLTNLPWGQYSVVEKTPPPGYQAVTETFAFEPIGPTKLQSTLQAHALVIDGGVRNKRLTGAVTWKKADADTNAALAGSTWQLSGPGIGSNVQIADCTQAPCAPGSATYFDADPTPGAFKVAGLQWDQTNPFTLKETQAPVGYQLDATPRPFLIRVDAATGKVVDYDFAVPFANKKQDVPRLPLTGGASADAFLFGGAGILMLAAGAWTVYQRRRAVMR